MDRDEAYRGSLSRRKIGAKEWRWGRSGCEMEITECKSCDGRGRRKAVFQLGEKCHNIVMSLEVQGSVRILSAVHIRKPKSNWVKKKIQKYHRMFLEVWS